MDGQSMHDLGEAQRTQQAAQSAPSACLLLLLLLLLQLLRALHLLQRAANHRVPFLQGPGSRGAAAMA